MWYKMLLVTFPVTLTNLGKLFSTKPEMKNSNVNFLFCFVTECLLVFILFLIVSVLVKVSLQPVLWKHDGFAHELLVIALCSPSANYYFPEIESCIINI